MKIKPVAKAAPSPIPTAAEAAADPSLLEAAPRRAPRGAGALLGAGLLGSLLAPGCTGRDASAPAATPPSAPAVSDPADAEAAARAEEAREAAATIVAPILQKALDEEGRGAFGCIVVDPPAMLSESDALDLIRQEFAKVGVELLPARELEERAFLPAERDGITPKDREEVSEEQLLELLDEDGTPALADDPPSWTSNGRKWIFDLATEDGTLLVEFLSCTDHNRLDWEKNVQITTNADGSVRGITIGGSTVRTYDFPQAAADLRNQFESHPAGKPATIALFFDPMANSGIDWDTLTDREEWEEAMARRERIRGKLSAINRELLREQVRFFLDWAQREGRLPAAPAPEG